MSIHELTQAANRLQRAIAGADVVVEESGSGRNFHVTVKSNGAEFFESGSVPFLLGFLQGFIAGNSQ